MASNNYLKRGDGRVVSEPRQLEGVRQGVGGAQMQVPEGQARGGPARQGAVSPCEQTPATDGHPHPGPGFCVIIVILAEDAWERREIG